MKHRSKKAATPCRPLPSNLGTAPEARDDEHTGRQLVDRFDPTARREVADPQELSSPSRKNHERCPACQHAARGPVHLPRQKRAKMRSKSSSGTSVASLGASAATATVNSATTIS